MDADNFIETAKPPASSEELLIREPLESLCRLFCRFTLVLPRLYAAILEAVLVLIVIIFVFLYFYVLQLPRRDRAVFPSVRPHPSGFSGKLLFLLPDVGIINRRGHRGEMHYRK
jgi:hypothetical protein